MKAHAIAISILLAGLASLVGCAGSLGAGDDGGCQVTLSYTPSPVIAGPDAEVRVSSTYSGAGGTPSYAWRVLKGGLPVAFQDAQSDHSEITFLATEPGTFNVTLDLTPSLGEFCPQGQATVNALLDANTLAARLHVTPPATVQAPLIDRAIQIHNATDFDMGAVVLEAGVVSTGVVRNGATGIPAYLQFIPLGMSGAIVETFANASGAYSVRLLDQPHDVIVIPAVAGVAPRKLLNMAPTQTVLAVNGGSTISGTVHQGGTAIANAKVQLTIDGVPTTLTTTAANGTFSVLGVPVSGASVKVEVTPPATSGLPRLEATGTLDVAATVDIAYGTLQLRNLGGVPVRRGGAAQLTKKVVIVGTVANVGTVTAGSSAIATGFVRIPTTTDGTGVLPLLFAPAGPLFAVTTVFAGDQVTPADLAVGSLDLTAGVPAQIDAPAMTPFSTTASGPTDPLDGATLDLVPTRALALAGASSRHFIADASGHVTGLLPTGGAFDVRWSDPASRRAPRVETDVTSVLGSYLLPPAVFVSGDLTVTGSSNPVVGASVQILCSTCSGLDRNRPIAEVASDQHGTFTVAVPDPGAL